VYGDYQGDWVDEGSELRAAGGKGWARVVAEHEWLSLQDAFGLPVHIFRCGGIYGEHWCVVCLLARLRLAAAGRQWRVGVLPSAAAATAAATPGSRQLA
jgi:nucleoside-diphosphate-sugar epimerase